MSETDHTDTDRPTDADFETDDTVSLGPEDDEREDDPNTGMADAEDFFVKRDGDDEVLPVRERAAGFGECVVKPMVYGEAESYFGDSGQVASASANEVADVLRNHVVEPDLDAYCKAQGYRHSFLSAYTLREEMLPFGPAALLMAILRASGYQNAQVDMNNQGQARIDLGDGDAGK